MRGYLIPALAFTLAACGSDEQTTEPTTVSISSSTETKPESDAIELPAGIELPPGAEITGRQKATMGEQVQLRFTFRTDKSTQDVLAFFAGKGMPLSTKEHPFWELYEGKAPDGTELQLQADEMFGEPIYHLQTGGTLTNIPKED